MHKQQGQKYEIILLFLLINSILLITARPGDLSPLLKNPPIENLTASFSASEKNNNSSSRLPSTENNKKTKTRILFASNSRQDSRDFDENQDIIFPDTYDALFKDIPKIDKPPKCAGKGTFCEEFDSYPHNLVKHLLEQKPISTDLFGKDESTDDDRFSISNRNGAEMEQYVCAALRKTIFPTVGKNKNNKWKYIINQGETEGYYQGVMVETCRQEGASCAVIGDAPIGFITKCKQKYISRRLVSISDKGEPLPDSFLMPSACCCSYKRDVEFLARFGAMETPINA